MMTLTHEHLEVLRKPFQANEHEFLNGNAYITEGAITERIEEIDPSWTFVIIQEYTRDNQCICVARMTICDVSRDGVGMQPLTIRLKKTGEIVDGTDPEKSAATDALKRCARLFGIGRYLLSLPDGVRDSTSMTRWLNQNTPQSHQEAPTRDLPPITVTTQAKAPVDALAGNGSDKPRNLTGKAADVWAYDLPALMAHPDLQVIKPYEHRKRAIEEQHRFGKFASVKNVGEAVQVVLNRNTEDVPA